MTRPFRAAFIASLFSVCSYAQDGISGQYNLEIGSRFNQHLTLPEAYEGFGIGLQARQYFGSKLANELNCDYYKFDLGGVGAKNVIQLGLSVAYYPFDFKNIKPYAFLGYNFNMMEVVPTSYIYLDRTEDIISGNQSRAFGGLGVNYYPQGDRFNIGLAVQYDFALSDPLSYKLEETEFGNFVNTNLGTNQSPDELQYLNVRLSISYRIADFSKTQEE